MLPDHASLPSDFGRDFTDADRRTRIPGMAPNSLTSTHWRDRIAGAAWHKRVVARIEPATTAAPSNPNQAATAR